MAGIQQTFNQILSSTASGLGMVKILHGQQEQLKAQREQPELTAKKIKEVEAEQAYRDAEARKMGFSDAYTQHEVQTAAQRAASDIEKKGEKLGFYTHEEPTGTAFDDPNPSDKYKLKGAIPPSIYSPDVKRIEDRAFQKFMDRITVKQNQKEAMKARMKLLEEGPTHTLNSKDFKVEV